MPQKTRKLLLDISLSCQEILDFIGEALHRLSGIEEDTLAEKIPEYRKIVDFRNIIAHSYDVIDEAVMWDFAVIRVPELKS